MIESSAWGEIARLPGLSNCFVSIPSLNCIPASVRGCVQPRDPEPHDPLTIPL